MLYKSIFIEFEIEEFGKVAHHKCKVETGGLFFDQSSTKQTQTKLFQIYNSDFEQLMLFDVECSPICELYCLI